MSKQYLTTHTVDDAHITDIFSVAATKTALISGSGSSTLKIYDTTKPEFPLVQSIDGAHKLGCHHVCTAKRGEDATIFASAGFGGEAIVWKRTDAGDWVELCRFEPSKNARDDIWAIALSSDESCLACTTHDGRIRVWDIASKTMFREYATGANESGSFALCVDLSRDGKYTATGHQNGDIFVFDNGTGRMVHSLSGLTKPVRAVTFSPQGKYLAAGGDAGIIALYDTAHGEHTGNLTLGGTNAAWITSLDASDSGEYLLSGSMDGKVRVWSVERSACVATHSETDRALWSVRWLPKRTTGADATRGESFCTAGANRSITFYREASGI